MNKNVSSTHPSCALLDQCTLKNVSCISSGNIFNDEFYFGKLNEKIWSIMTFFWQTSICILLECIHTLFGRMKVRKAFWDIFKNATTSICCKYVTYVEYMFLWILSMWDLLQMRRKDVYNMTTEMMLYFYVFLLLRQTVVGLCLFPNMSQD